jgi:hypothetical protein
MSDRSYYPGNDWCFPSKPRSPCAGQLVIKPAPEVPDPAVYSQEELLPTGALTFDNPDVALDIDPVLDGGVWKFPDPRFLPDAKITVHNLSNRVSAINTLVGCSTSLFGIGFPLTGLGTQLVSIPAGGQVDVFFPSPPHPADWFGDVLFVELSHPADRRLINNHGWYGVAPMLVTASGGPIQIPFFARNNFPDQRTINLTLLPNTLHGTVTPQSVDTPPGEPIAAAINIDEPPDPPSQGQVTVIGTTGSSLIGGITFKVFVSPP